jgi:hypothetical protein
MAVLYWVYQILLLCITGYCLFFSRQPSPIKTASAHVRGYTKNDIEHFLSSCFPGGYQFKFFGGSNFYPFSPSLARPLAKVFPNLAWGIFFLLQKIGNTVLNLLSI